MANIGKTLNNFLKINCVIITQPSQLDVPLTLYLQQMFLAF